ncbi:MAG: glycosyltransferase [Phycisphaerae bacterium]|nr:glycosyltransferase [Phycisphaerae bacterium]
MTETLRVLHAPIPALYQPWLYAEGLRASGCRADAMCFHFSETDRWLTHSIDINLGLDGMSPISEEISAEMDFLISALQSYDVFHFHSGFSLLRDHTGFTRRLSELSLLKKLGKKIVLHWWGWCERRTDRMEARYQYLPCQECRLDPRQWCQRPEKQLLCEWADEHADLQLSTGALCAALPQVKWFNNSIDTDLWRPMGREEIPKEFLLPPTDNVRIYHSFGNQEIRGDVKGSREIQRAVERLKDEGFAVEFMFFDKVPNLQLRYYQTQADIVVDQLRDGWHGTTAAECMACGKPVITFIHPEVASIAPKDHPLINATMATIYDVIKQLVRDRELREEIGRKSREYALREHSHKVLGKRLLNLYKTI